MKRFVCLLALVCVLLSVSDASAFGFFRGLRFRNRAAAVQVNVGVGAPAAAVRVNSFSRGFSTFHFNRFSTFRFRSGFYAAPFRAFGFGSYGSFYSASPALYSAPLAAYGGGCPGTGDFSARVQAEVSRQLELRDLRQEVDRLKYELQYRPPGNR